eukprot:CAMPEP_0202891646 /NCGR_PEP_ID=MMETSP1392-20130828/1655_1 /ASSEMBLY_ACC=CAM_ASM_000868 /TAXON_ID=225041 /ORGANISM="Chlamydomonas chlamydogama, Strain SAG 11-48b" /LENGTH=314 /DNA_ID=CAMNT_0049575465 /DNA_START=242 /DNA_END=1183 /DNA_ORIENTATION=+
MDLRCHSTGMVLECALDPTILQGHSLPSTPASLVGLSRQLSDPVLSISEVQPGDLVVLPHQHGTVMEADKFTLACQRLNTRPRLLLADAVGCASKANKQRLLAAVQQLQQGSLAISLSRTFMLYWSLPQRARKYTITPRDLPSPSSEAQPAGSISEAMNVLSHSSFTFEGACKAVLHLLHNRSVFEVKGLLPHGSVAQLSQQRDLLTAVARSQLPNVQEGVSLVGEWAEAFDFKQARHREEAHPLQGRHAAALVQVLKDAVAGGLPCVDLFKHVAEAAVAAAEAEVLGIGSDREDVGDVMEEGDMVQFVANITW